MKSNKDYKNILKNVTHLSTHDKWVVKTLVATVEILDKMVTEITNVKKETDRRFNRMAEYIEGLEGDVRFLRHYLELKKSDKFKSITKLKMFNMKRENPFNEGTN